MADQSSKSETQEDTSLTFSNHQWCWLPATSHFLDMKLWTGFFKAHY